MKIEQFPEKIRGEMRKPLEEKLEDTINCIKNQLAKHSYGSYLACSFGKDSMLVLYLTRMIRKDIPVVFNNTFVEHPETYKFRDCIVNEWDLNYIETKPTKPFWEVVKGRKMEDGRKHFDHCCYYLKRRPMALCIKERGFTTQFDGITAIESRHRMFSICKYGVVYFSKKEKIIKVHPIAYWTEKEVWKYTKENNIPINPAYEKGLDRLGCIVCTAYKNWRESMAKHYPGIYKRIQEEHFGQKVLI